MAQGLPTPRLATRRFNLCKLEQEDAPAFFPTLSDPEQCRFLTREAFATLDELTGWLCDPDWNGRSWTVRQRESGAIVARIVAVPECERTSEIGYITVAGHRGEGIATECSAAVIAHLFAEEDHHRVTAGTDPRNAASNAVLQKLGFRREGHLLSCAKTHEGWCDEYRWGMLRSEWEQALA